MIWFAGVRGGRKPPNFCWNSTTRQIDSRRSGDLVRVESSLAYYLALQNARVPAKLHIYAQGVHGFGLRPRVVPIMGWPKLVETWLHTIKVVPEN
jgi:acetyl esterase/lipase